MAWECPCKVSERSAAFLATQPEAKMGVWEIAPVLVRARGAGIPPREFVEHLCADLRVKAASREGPAIAPGCRTEGREFLFAS